LERLWFVTIDIARLRCALRGRAFVAAGRALAPAAAAAGSRVVEAAVVPWGVRALVAASSVEGLRVFVRRFVAYSRSIGSPVAWRPQFQAARVRPDAVRSVRAQLERMRKVRNDEKVIVSSLKARSAGTCRKITSLFRLIDRGIDAILGSDEVASRTRRYVADHDAPPDDAAAFGRLCVVVFAQGLGFEAVAARAGALRAAFSDFVPAAVAVFDDARVAALHTSPIIRNEAKIRACIENARRWVSLTSDGATYLGRVAAVAAQDNAVGGWPELAAMLRNDFARLGDTAARQTLKRWGFFTSLAHPGARRALERLGLVDEKVESVRVQSLLGSVAQRLGRDPYAVEAVLALFAGIGPCKKVPDCAACTASDKCPSAVLNSR
jgi:3-methyladenine DNA glycosylase Tag/predicted secreted protein